MIELVFVVLIGFAGFVAGIIAEGNTIQEKCVAKYSYMPHGEVGDYCKTILKFEKDPK